MPPSKRQRRGIVDDYLLEGLRHTPPLQANRGGGTPLRRNHRRGGGTPRAKSRNSSRGGRTPHFAYDRRANRYRYNRGAGIFSKIAKSAVGVGKDWRRKG